MITYVINSKPISFAFASPQFKLCFFNQRFYEYTYNKNRKTITLLRFARGYRYAKFAVLAVLLDE